MASLHSLIGSKPTSSIAHHKPRPGTTWHKNPAPKYPSNKCWAKNNSNHGVETLSVRPGASQAHAPKTTFDISCNTNKGYKIILSKLDKQSEKIIIGIAQSAILKSVYHKEIAKLVKHELEKKFGVYWNVIVGAQFESYVSFKKGFYINFKIDQLEFLIYKVLDVHH